MEHPKKRHLIFERSITYHNRVIVIHSKYSLQLVIAKICIDTEAVDRVESGAMASL